MDTEVWLGLLIALLAGICYDVGYGLQALDARDVEHTHALRPSLIVQLARRRRWLAAMALSVLGWPLQILAFSLAPVTLVQPTLALGLLILLFFGVRVLGEHVGPREIGAVVCIIAGVVCVTVSAPAKGEVTVSGGALYVALGILALLTLAPYVLGAQRWRGSLLLILGAGAADGAAAFLAKIISDDAATGYWLGAIGWALATGAAVALGFLSELTALQRSPATRVAPIVLCCQIAIPVVLAPIVAGEDWGATPGGGVLIVIGLVLVLAGAALLGATKAVSGLITGAEAPPGGELDAGAPPVAADETAAASPGRVGG